MIQTFSFSEPGGHAENQDALLIQPHPAEPSCYLCAVTDGQGGHSGAAAAARLACQECIAAASALSVSRFITPSTWSNIVARADRVVAADREAGFTTLVAFCVTEDWLFGASSGDSAAVVLSANQSASIVTSAQHKNPPVGSGGARPVGFHARLHSPWTVLAMTDGVWKYAGWDSILGTGATQAGDEILAALQSRARLPGSGAFQDDFTLVVVQSRDIQIA